LLQEEGSESGERSGRWILRLDGRSRLEMVDTKNLEKVDRIDEALTKPSTHLLRKEVAKETDLFTKARSPTYFTTYFFYSWRKVHRRAKEPLMTFQHQMSRSQERKREITEDHLISIYIKAFMNPAIP
jgi:hypothetical protein